MRKNGFIIKEEEYHNDNLVKIARYIAQVNCVIEENINLPEIN